MTYTTINHHWMKSEQQDHVDNCYTVFYWPSPTVKTTPKEKNKAPQNNQSNVIINS